FRCRINIKEAMVPKVTFIHSSGNAQTFEVEEGQSFMRAAVANSVDGIIGQCGGNAQCATCHVYVERVDRDLPELSEDEDEMLFCASADRLDESRLGCQLAAGRDFEEISVRVPENQV